MQPNMDSAVDCGMSAKEFPKMKLKGSATSMIGKRTRRGGAGGRRLSYSPETDRQLLEWVMERSRSGLPVSRDSIQTQALSLVRDECPDFKASSGWVEKFLIRHKISLPTRASMLGKETVVFNAGLKLWVNGSWEEAIEGPTLCLGKEFILYINVVNHL